MDDAHRRRVMRGAGFGGRDAGGPFVGRAAAALPYRIVTSAIAVRSALI